MNRRATLTTLSTALAVAVAVAVVVAAPSPGAEPAPAELAAPAEGVLTDEGGHTVAGPTGREYVLYGTTWNRTALTYGFGNHTPDLSVPAQEAAVAAALATWSSVSPFTFSPVPDCGYPFNDSRCETPDLRISFGVGTHAGSGDPAFDGPGGTVAHAYYPPPNGLSAAGDIHFDDAETWVTSGGGVDLQTIALHEIGHALGLAHATNDRCSTGLGDDRSIMCAVLIGTDRTLAADDVAGIQALYGPPADACGGYAVTVDLGEGDVPTTGDDVIRGTDGDDVIDALGGNDIVCAGDGHDRVVGGPGNDRLLGGRGRDDLRGWAGADRLVGAKGTDTLVGGKGPDSLSGGTGTDDCRGGRGTDTGASCERRRGIP